MKQTVQTLQAMKERGEKIAMLTCYDYTTAKLMDEAGMNMLLVGDSLGNVILGYSDTISVTMEDMIHHTAAVSRGVQNAMVVADMPFLSYQTSVYDAVVNAGRLMKEGRAGAVKLLFLLLFMHHRRSRRQSGNNLLRGHAVVMQKLFECFHFKHFSLGFQFLKKLLVLIDFFFKLRNFLIESIQSGFLSCHFHAP